MRKKSTQQKRSNKFGDTVFDYFKEFRPLTENQDIIHQSWKKGKNIGALGYAGSGKTYIAVYEALDLLRNGDVERINIYRSAVQSRDIGFLPGTEEEKMQAFEKPYIALVNQILCRDDAYEILKKKNAINFESTSFLRGITLNDTAIIVDEAQNLDDGEINTIMTRIGKHTRIFICGDIRQTDLNYNQSGLAFMQKVLTNMPEWFTIVEMEADDIVRSGLVKDWIINVEKFKIKNGIK